MFGLGRRDPVFLIGLVYLSLAYALGWFIHAIVFAGTFAALDKWNPQLLCRKRVQLEFWVAMAAALLSIWLPMLLLHTLNGEIEIIIPLAIAGVTLYSDYRNLREKSIEREHLNGDIVGYAFGLATVAAAVKLQAPS